jgi:hypothetical protein
MLGEFADPIDSDSPKRKMFLPGTGRWQRRGRAKP